MALKIKDIPEEEMIHPGSRACSGCGMLLAYRHILKAMGEKTVAVVPACCLTVVHGFYPISSVKVPTINTAFACAAATASGVVAGLKAKGRHDYNVLVMAGDGGTYDIGIQSLSAAAERGTDFIYICYDNEAYMYTGNQRSSATPLAAYTTTTPVLGKEVHKKDMLAIMEAHNPPYIATASSGYLLDLYEKVLKAKEIKGGTRFILVNVACNPGWGFAVAETVKTAKLAVECGMVVLSEIENGRFQLTGRSRRLAEKGDLVPLEEYISSQARFKGIEPEQARELQNWVDKRWKRYVERHRGIC